MDDYKLYTDKSSLFECHIELEGASLNNAQARLVVETSNGMGLVFRGKISENGECKIPVHKVRGFLDESATGNIKLEVIAEDTYFQPWESPFSVTASKKLTVEVKQPDVAKMKVEVKKPEVVVTKTVPPPDTTLREAAIAVTKSLIKEGITVENMPNYRQTVKRCVDANANSIRNVDRSKLIQMVVELLARSN